MGAQNFDGMTWTLDWGFLCEGDMIAQSGIKWVWTPREFLYCNVVGPIRHSGASLNRISYAITCNRISTLNIYTVFFSFLVSLPLVYRYLAYFPSFNYSGATAALYQIIFKDLLLFTAACGTLLCTRRIEKELIYQSILHLFLCYRKMLKKNNWWVFHHSHFDFKHPFK